MTMDFGTLGIIKVLYACKLSLRNPAEERERRIADPAALCGRSDD